MSEDQVGEGVVEKLRNLKDAGAERIQETLDDSRQLIRSRPVTSVLVAFGVGAVIGALLGRSCSSDR